MTGDGKYAFALQSKRNETQSADSFARVLWPFGGSFLDADFKSNLNSAESQAGLKFRQDLMQYMPDGIVAYDHAETVNGFTQGDVAMITEWSAFYSTIVSPDTSKVVDCVEIAPEPMGPAGRAGPWWLLACCDKSGRRSRTGSRLFVHPVGNLKSQCTGIFRAWRCSCSTVRLYARWLGRLQIRASAC